MKSNHFRVLWVTAIAMAAGHAQTTIDLRTQGRSVDFGGATYTRPAKTGPALPPTCSVGEVFFSTSATPGKNLYVCGIANTWVPVSSGQNVPAPSGANKVLSTDGSATDWRSMGGDVSGSPESLQVTGIQGRPVGVMLPSGSQALRWNAAAAQWQPAADPIPTVFGRTGAISAQSGDYNFSQIAGAVGISQGGTGATSAGQALTNLGAAALSHRHNASDVNGVSGLHGNATALQMFSGTANANECAKFDSTGNLVSAGAPCGTGLPSANGIPNMVLATDGTSSQWRTIGSGLALSGLSLGVDGSLVPLLGNQNTFTEPNIFQNGLTVSGATSFSDQSTAGYTAPVRVVTANPGACQANREMIINSTDGHIYRCNASGLGWVQIDGGSGGTSGGLLATNNLSDLANVATARTNLGLGTAALKGVSGSGTTLQAFGGGTASTNDCAKFDASGNIVSAGAPCGTGGTGGALLATNNLSDVASVATARTNLGLGAAALKGVAGNGTAVQAFGGGTTSTNDCAKFDANGNIVSAGAPCGTGGTPGALLAANNLSDVASAATARTNLGLGAAALKGVTGTGTTVPAFGGGTTSANDCAKFDASGNIVSAGSPCGTGGTPGALLASNNLSDLASAATARINLGLGAAALKGVTGNGTTLQAFGGGTANTNDCAKFDSSGNIISTGAPCATSGLLPANNLSDLSNTATARTNLGLGSAAVKTVAGTGTALQAFGGGTANTNDCAKFDANGNIVSAGSPCSSGGGSTDFYPLDTRMVWWAEEFLTYNAPTNSTNINTLRWAFYGTNTTFAYQDSAFPNLGVARLGITSSAASNWASLGLGLASQRVLGPLMATSVAWEVKYIFRAGQTSNTKLRIGFATNSTIQLATDGLFLRFDTSLGDSGFVWEARVGGSPSATSAAAVDTNWHTIKFRGISSGKVGMSIDGGAEKTVCASGGGCDLSATLSSTAVSPVMIVGADSAGATNYVDLDYVGFWARVSSAASGERQ